MIPPLLTETDLPDLNLVHRGKVRDLYDLGEHLLLVATDRVSSFDCVLSPGIPYKGVVLNTLSGWWFQQFEAAGVRTHFVTNDIDEMPDAVRAYASQLRGRATLGHKAKIVPVECVVRGYLAGSAVPEYKKKGTVGLVEAPQGLQPGDRLETPLFTPSTKAVVGHDEPITFAQVAAEQGEALAGELRDAALRCYNLGRDAAEARGLILVDTKFEFGHAESGELLLCDEVLTPDSSRYWLRDAWKPGHMPDPMDKQLVRNHLLTLDWDRSPPAPPLPPEIVVETARRYLELFRLLTGHSLLNG